MSWFRRIGDAFGRRSIGSKMRAGFLVMAAGMLIVSAMTLVSLRAFLTDYHVVAARIAAANRTYPVAKEQIGTDAYYLVAGRTTPQSSTLPDDMAELERSIGSLKTQNNSREGAVQLRIAERTMGTLQKYCDRLVWQQQLNLSIEKQNETLEQIREVSSLVSEQINEYIYLELQHMETLDLRIQNRVRLLLTAGVGILAFALAVMVLVQRLMTKSISAPINALVENTRRLSEGDFSAYVTNQGANEIDVLNGSFNRMVKKLENLMHELETNTRTREQLELRLMQEQINPHFLYNTLEIIVWLAESGEKEKVIGVVQSLSRFFRVVLSQGRAVVSVREELDCIRNYLYIQQVRYADILTYEIDASESTLDMAVQKLSLQPLVENALYHGIKGKRGGGTIRVQAREAGNRLQIRVTDTGCGMSAEQLAQLREAIRGGRPMGRGFGLSNVQKRIQLEYGPDYGVRISSAPGEGTAVTMYIPARPYTS